MTTGLTGTGGDKREDTEACGARPMRLDQDVGASSFGFRFTSVTFTFSVSGAPNVSTIIPRLVPVTSKAK
ncbi:hypothetical protein ABZ250_29525 [Streptomyces afghaniensis]|uniref:hypothetical protein n=1 Tax=Streptomyces afghaniensis TaxID=66865 RepID=UPI0033AF6A96